MERIIKTVSFFLKCQDSKDFSINQRNNIMKIVKQRVKLLDTMREVDNRVLKIKLN